MSLMLLVAALVSAAPQPETRVLCPGFATEGLSAQAAGALVDRFASELGKAPGLKVVTNRDVAQLLGLERQKQLLGCADDDSSACLAELAGAIGADLMVTGSVVKVGSRFTATVRVLRLPGGQVLVSESSRAEGEDALSDWLDEVARVLPSRLRPAGSSAGPAPLQPSAWAPWLVVGAGAAAAITGGVFFGLAQDSVRALEAPTAQTDIDATVATGRTHEALGGGLLTGGGVAVAAGLAWYFLARPKTGVAVMVGPGGVMVGGTLP